jgi:hypothetical protein
MPWMNPDIHDASQVLKGKEKKMRIDEDVHHGVVISWPTSPHTHTPPPKKNSATSLFFRNSAGGSLNSSLPSSQ